MKFAIKKIYLKDASFESPSSPGIFTRTGIRPEFDLQIFVDYRPIDEKAGLAEIVLKTTVTSKHEETTLFLAEVHQAGVFEIEHPEKETYQIIVEVTCPQILLPFAREELNSLVTKGGFSPFLLAPINFESIYGAKKEQEKERQTNAQAPESANQGIDIVTT